MRTEIIIAGLIGAGAAILSSAITGFITYKVAVQTDKLQGYRQKLIKAFEDISVLYQLESMYAQEVAELRNLKPATVRRNFRDQAENDGFGKPSRYAVPSYTREELDKLRRA
jgi:hypothetical protein